jgi:hypothetical protein
MEIFLEYGPSLKMKGNISMNFEYFVCFEEISKKYIRVANTLNLTIVPVFRYLVFKNVVGRYILFIRHIFGNNSVIYIV